MSKFLIGKIVALAVMSVLLSPAWAAAPDELGKLVEAYFRAKKASVRLGIAGKISPLAGDKLQDLEASLRKMVLAEKLAPGEDEIYIFTPAGIKIRILTRIGAGYDPAKPQPLILTFADRAEPAEEAIHYWAKVLGNGADDFLIACPSGFAPITFHSPRAQADVLPHVLTACMKRYRVNPSAVFLAGRGRGAAQAMLTATFGGSRIAGVIAQDGALDVPFRVFSYPIFLENLSRVPMLLHWSAPSPAASQPAGLEGSWTVLSNRYLVELADKKGLPITGLELPGTEQIDVRFPFEALGKLLQGRREAYPKQVDHWFRYPEQGEAAWLRQIEFEGTVWVGDQLDIVVPELDGAASYVRRTIESKLAYVGGQIDGQTISITTRQTKKVGLLLHDRLVDLDKPVRVLLNGREYFNEKLRRSPFVMLEEAYRTRDVDRLFSTGLIIDKSGRVQKRG